MAKTMARIENGIVVNMEWCSDNTHETDTLINPGDRAVGIGDTYADGKFFRDDSEILTPLEAALLEIQKLKAENEDMQAALEIMEVTPDE